MRRTWPNGWLSRQNQTNLLTSAIFPLLASLHITSSSQAPFDTDAGASIFFLFRLEVHSETHSTYSSYTRDTRDAGLPFRTLIIWAEAQLVKIHIFFVPLVSKVFFCIVRPIIWLTTIKTLLYRVGLAS